MGYQADITILMDELYNIAEDPLFGRILSDAISAQHGLEPLRFGNAGTVLGKHHASDTALCVTTGNTGRMLTAEHLGADGYQSFDECATRVVSDYYRRSCSDATALKTAERTIKMLRAKVNKLEKKLAEKEGK